MDELILPCVQMLGISKIGTLEAYIFMRGHFNRGLREIERSRHSLKILKNTERSMRKKLFCGINEIDFLLQFLIVLK